MAVFDKFTGIGVASGFKLQAKAPLDGRLVVDTTADRDALVTENGAYEGMVVYVKADKTLYKLDGTTTSDWSAIGGDVAADLGELTGRVSAVEGDIDTIEENLNQKVPNTRKINNKALSADITLSASDVGAIPATQKGANNGVAELDETGKVPSSQLPSYVDDAVEGYLYNSKFYKESTHTTEITAESSKIYVTLDTNKTYRWSGTAYVEISAGVALGETSSTAYRGDKGKIAYDHSQTAHAPSDAEKNVVVGVQVNGSDLTPDGSRKVNVEVPTKVSELENDSGYLTSTGTAAKANQLTTARTIDGVSFNGTANIAHYGTCSTAAATAAKAVTLTGFTLATGARVTVKFTVTNTAANPTLNINSTGAKAIYYKGAAITAGYLAANKVYEFVYDGTNYVLVGDVDTNTTYSNATTSTAGLMSAADKVKVDAMPTITVSATAPSTAAPNSLWLKIDE